jgi:hypothetical protein
LRAGNIQLTKDARETANQWHRPQQRYAACPFIEIDICVIGPLPKPETGALLFPKGVTLIHFFTPGVQCYCLDFLRLRHKAFGDDVACVTPG